MLCFKKTELELFILRKEEDSCLPDRGVERMIPQYMCHTLNTENTI